MLGQARARGYLGDQPVQAQIEHSLGFVAVSKALLNGESREGDEHEVALPPGRRCRLLDLGSGGGIPGLVLALAFADIFERIVLLDGSLRRAAWLQHAVESLALPSGVEVVGERAELAGRKPQWRAGFSIVTSRSFGRPAVAAECAAPFLRVGGHLIVSEPPSVGWAPTSSEPGEVAAPRAGGPSPRLQERWPPDAVGELGFAPAIEWAAGGYRFATLQLSSQCPGRYPRRTGIPAKRPLF